MDRRSFLKTSAAAGTVASVGFGLDFWKGAFAAPATAGTGPYGALEPINPHGLRLPAGFTSRIVAVTGQVPAAPADAGRAPYAWHGAPDGAATFATEDGGWILVSNAELGSGNGGVGALRFNEAGDVVDAYPILRGTSGNCAGGPTPWGTWLSCEEIGNAGTLWECDPRTPVTGPDLTQRREAFGYRNHEAVAVDPVAQTFYLTEDSGSGRFYRFTPSNPPLASGSYDMSAGLLEAAFRNDDDATGRQGLMTWVPVADRTTGYRGTDSSVFRGGEGCWFDNGFVYWACKGDDSVWALECATQRFELIHRPDISTGSTLGGGTDNVFVSPYSGDVFVAEDGPSEPEIHLLTPPDEQGGRTVAPFVQLLNSTNSEICGPCFSPDGTRLYFSSQRGYNANAPAGVPLNQGITYEISGPFRVTRDVEVPALGAVGSQLGGLAGLAGAAAVAAGAAALLGRRSRVAAAGAGATVEGPDDDLVA